MNYPAPWGGVSLRPSPTVVPLGGTKVGQAPLEVLGRKILLQNFSAQRTDFY